MREMENEIFNTMVLRQRNRNTVLSILIRKVTATKNELQAETQFSYSTIGNILNDLLKGGYISEIRKGPSTGGRKPVILSLNYENYLFLSLDFSNKNFHWSVHDLRGVIIFDHFYKYDYQIDLEKNIRRNLEDIVSICGSRNVDIKKIRGLGIATPGYYKEEEDRIFRSSYEELESVNIKKIFSQKFNIPIIILNDANVAAYNEVYSANYMNSKCLVYLLITREGVGSAIWIKGEIFSGAKGSAGEVHMSPIEHKGKLTTLGDMLHPETDLSWISERLGMSIDEKVFFRLFEEKNTYALMLYEKTVHALSTALSQVFNILNPSDIIISGFYNRYGCRMAEDVLMKIKEQTHPSQCEDLMVSLSHFSGDTILMGLGKKMINNWCGNI